MAKYYKTYEAWKAAVAQAMEALCGMDPDCLPDYDYRRAFADGKPPIATARAALRAAREF